MPPVYHFTHLANLPGILAMGSLRCHSQAETVTDVADEGIKSSRTRKRVPCGPGGFICDYVPFYFASRSPMLFRIDRGGVEGYADGQGPLVYLVTRTERIVAAGLRCVFTNGNAAAAITMFGLCDRARAARNRCWLWNCAAATIVAPPATTPRNKPISSRALTG